MIREGYLFFIFGDTYLKVLSFDGLKLKFMLGSDDGHVSTPPRILKSRRRQQPGTLRMLYIRFSLLSPMNFIY